MLVVFPPIFVAGIKIIYGYNFVALSNKSKILLCQFTLQKLLLTL